MSGLRRRELLGAASQDYPAQLRQARVVALGIHDEHRVAVTDELLGKQAGDVGLAGARPPVMTTLTENAGTTASVPSSKVPSTMCRSRGNMGCLPFTSAPSEQLDAAGAVG
jgi:hypothetical protein